MYTIDHILEVTLNVAHDMPHNMRWVEKCPERVEKRLLKLATARMRVAEQNDPTRFSVRDVEGNEFRCTLGSPHFCSCNSTQPCAHVLSVLTSFFNASCDNPVVWQQFIRELDLQELIDKRSANQQCFFCREEAKHGDFCCACGTRFHSLCLELAAKSKKYRQGCCPRCGECDVKRASADTILCSKCGKKCDAEYFVCLLCPAVHLCAVCHALPKVHASHPFQRVHFPRRMSVPEGVASSTAGDLQYREINPEDYEALLRLDTAPSKTLSRDEVSRLPVEAFAVRSRANDVCPVCLVSFVADDACVVLPCCHVLHEHCGVRWLSKYSAVCPIDKLSASPNNGSRRPPAAHEKKSLTPLPRSGGPANRRTQAAAGLKLPFIARNK